MNLLMTEGPAEIHNVQHGLERIEIIVDSGAAESVAPPAVGQAFAVMESEGSKCGQQYITADGHRIPNLGQKSIFAETNEGNVVSLGFQLAEVTKPLASVGKMCDAGNQVVFGPQGGHILNLMSGRVTEFKRANGVYILEAWASAANQGFAWQG